MKRRLTAKHRRDIGRAMRGKNVAPRSLVHRAAIAASRHLPRTDPGWRRVYAAKLRQLRLAASLTETSPPA